MAKNPFRALCLPIFAALCLAACRPLFNPQPAADPALAATQTAQRALLERIAATLTAIPSITPGGQAAQAELPRPLSTPLPAPAGSAQAAVTAADGMALVYVPAGEFIMGSTKYDRDLETNEVPQRTVYLDAFWISRTQVTNAMFARCVSAGACQYSASDKTNPRYQDPAYADHPVVYVSWQAAESYCEWSGGRLPTAAEWEKAARGVQGQKYPWGDAAPSVETVNTNNTVGDTTPVGQYPAGASPYGALDMGGNVREWVWDWYDPYYYQYAPDRNPAGPAIGEKKVLKGSSFSDTYRYARPANRLAHDPASPGVNRGFRCAYP
ncbi:MAG: SUMF1/EgtB/PvdO family nonheme iron enzyme [Anaerolineae bacterium]|nr:SUMF1/EgtB/PvdO family nonheme iron enzyme [Anaerolineae bacterium]